MNVLSLFDGISCGMIALERSGKKITNYYASEIDKYAIKISKKNYPGIIHIGDVEKVYFSKGVLYTESGEYNVGKIDLLIGGSPCQGFSFAGSGLNFNDPRSRLFFQYWRIKNEIQRENPDLKFLLENVKMKKEFQKVISDYLGIEPIKINSALVSAQNRERLYWTNINNGCIPQPEDKGIMLCDIKEQNVSEKYIYTKNAIEYMNRKVSGGRSHWDFDHHSSSENNKSACVVSNFYKGVPYNVLLDFVGGINEGKRLEDGKLNSRNFRQGYRIYSDKLKASCLTAQPIGGPGGATGLYLIGEAIIRKLTPIECERLQTISDGYTEGVSDTQRYKAIGNGWTVDVISHIFSFI